MSIQSFGRAVVLVSAAVLFGWGVTATMSARGRGSDESHRRSLDRDRDGDDQSPHIGHVFVIVLENEGFDATFGPQSKAPYLSQTLTKQGVLLSQYYGTGHASLDNYIAMISGQAATPETRNDCQTYADLVMSGITPDGQAIGRGCVYPGRDQDAAGSAQRRRQDLAGLHGRHGKRSGPGIGDVRPSDPQRARSHAERGGAVHRCPLGDAYAARHNPFS
jgi:phosphatidylinositol-3-phosphatase